MSGLQISKLRDTVQFKSSPFFSEHVRIRLVKSLLVTPGTGRGFDKPNPALWLAFYRGRGAVWAGFRRGRLSLPGRGSTACRGPSVAVSFVGSLRWADGYRDAVEYCVA